MSGWKFFCNILSGICLAGALLLSSRLVVLLATDSPAVDGTAWRVLLCSLGFIMWWQANGDSE